MNSFDEVFTRVKQYCLEEGDIPEVAVKLWIYALIPVRLDGTTALFSVQSEFQRDVILNNYESLLKEAFLSILGFEVDIRIQVDDETTMPAHNSRKPKDFDELARRHEELEHSFEGANYEYTFDTFIVGGSNEFAYAACTAVAKEPGKNYNPLFIYGPSGLGKTHLMHAIAHEVHQNHPNYKIIYVTSEEFGNDFIACINNGNTANFHDKYRNADVLLVDDVQFFSNKESMQEEFFHTFNKLHAEGKQIVLTSDKSPKELKTLEERIRSRFEWGLITDISTPDFETRIAIIRRKAELLDLYIPDDVSEFIANRLKTNIRQLEGAVKKLKALKHLAGSAPSISMAQSVIKDILSDDQPVPITVEKIIVEVADVYGVSPEDIRSSKRSSQISTARKVAIYVVREITQMPLQAIGTEFGGRDHSTIVYSISNVETAMKHDEHLKQLVEDIIKNIRSKSHG
ncbi:chromosomal replication initiator protein DnaA [Ruminococcus sp.]|uniref:chromosomal replication initiator protein DnaA n=1 Tax=Ruminococcus sp. TaxID=41978 RepID=UPI0025E6C490|nr:chromosomal replication initiator protein DnaA [Ruminococcus sp.]